MTKITYTAECTLTAQDRYHEIVNFLKQHQIVAIEFLKKDGSTRIIEATTDTKLMPPKDAEEFHKTRVIDYDTMPVWSLGDTAWRSFKTMNVISIKEKDEFSNHWTIALEQDPKTGDLILPFPTDLLAQVGWDAGDVLVWHDHNDGTFSLTKKEETDDK